MVDEMVNKINKAKGGVPPDSYHDVPPDNSHQQSLVDFLEGLGINTKNLATINPLILKNYIEAYQSKYGDPSMLQNSKTSHSGMWNPLCGHMGLNLGVPGPIDRNLIEIISDKLKNGGKEQRVEVDNVTGTKDKNNVPPDESYHGVPPKVTEGTPLISILQNYFNKGGEINVRGNYNAHIPIISRGTLNENAGGGPGEARKGPIPREHIDILMEKMQERGWNPTVHDNKVTINKKGLLMRR